MLGGGILLQPIGRHACDPAITDRLSQVQGLARVAGIEGEPRQTRIVAIKRSAGSRRHQFNFGPVWAAQCGGREGSVRRSLPLRRETGDTLGERQFTIETEPSAQFFIARGVSLGMHQLTKGDIAVQARVRDIQGLQRRINEVTAIDALKGLGIGLSILRTHHLGHPGECVRAQSGQSQRHRRDVQAHFALHTCPATVEPARPR